MKRFLKDLWLDLKTRYRRRMLIILVCFLLGITATAVKYFLTEDLYDQQGAKRWSEEKDYAQLSCFYPAQDVYPENTFIDRHYALASELKTAAVETDEEAKLFVDAYSVLGEVTMTTSHGTVTVNTYGVSDDFFLFHPMELLSGSYFDDEMLMGDGVILDEGTSWKLFGSSDVEGMTLEVNGEPSYVRGVVRQPGGHFNEAAGLSKSNCYIPFSTFENMAEKTGGYTYEVLMPNKVEGFARGIFDTVVGGENEDMEVIENSARFGFDHMKEVAKNFGIRSMSQKGIIYPYWENVARAIEDICSILWLIQLITAVIFAVLVIHIVYRQWKKRKPPKGSFLRWIENKKENWTQRQNKRKKVKKKHKKVLEE